MSIKAKSLADGVLTASLVDQYTAPANTRTVIKSASFCNTTGGAVLLTVKLVPRSGGTARTVIDEESLADTDTYLAPECINQVLEAGGKIQALGLNIEVYISGVEIT